ncbi:MAG TPA: hypothetical protein VK524_22515 [Polyangiaceae bacterium]|nr:hypothetical protein [Polyangiaceae bacterium]
MRRAAILVACLLTSGALVVACGKDENANTPGTGGAAGTGGRGGNAGSGGVRSDAGLKPCLDRPTELERPPSGQLPCDLIPPGLSL